MWKLVIMCNSLQITQLKLSYEERFRGLMPSAVRQVWLYSMVLSSYWKNRIVSVIKVPSVKQIKTKVIDDGWNDEYMTEISLESSKILLFI
jgi:hypothetical protein